jgi:hypothetical protein
MAKQVQLRRGTTLEHNAFTGAAGEITVDTTKDTIVVHNGTTVGGVPLARQSSVDLKADSTHNHDGVYQKQNDEIIVDITSPNVTSGTWNSESSTKWGTPRIGTYNALLGGTAAYRQWVIPDGMDTCYISHLLWNDGGYVDVHGIQADGGLILLRRINTHQAVENSAAGPAAAVDGGNPNQYDGSTVTLAGTGLSTFNSIRFTVQSGYFHLTGMSFSSNKLVGSEGTGIVNWNQLTQVPSLAPTNSPTFTGTVSGISKSMVGLGSVDNTTDAAKPVSTSQESRIKQAEANALAFAIALG